MQAHAYICTQSKPVWTNQYLMSCAQRLKQCNILTHEFEALTMHNGMSVSRLGRDQCLWTSLFRPGEESAEPSTGQIQHGLKQATSKIWLMYQKGWSQVFWQNRSTLQSIYESCLNQQPTNHGYCIAQRPRSSAFQGCRIIDHVQNLTDIQLKATANVEKGQGAQRTTDLLKTSPSANSPEAARA